MSLFELSSGGYCISGPADRDAAIGLDPCVRVTKSPHLRVGITRLLGPSWRLGRGLLAARVAGLANQLALFQLVGMLSQVQQLRGAAARCSCETLRLGFIGFAI